MTEEQTMRTWEVQVSFFVPLPGVEKSLLFLGTYLIDALDMEQAAVLVLDYKDKMLSEGLEKLDISYIKEVKSPF